MVWNIRNSSAVLLILWAAQFCTSATAQVTDIRVVAFRPPSLLLPGYVVHDVFIDFDGQYVGSLMTITLEQGQIYQHDSPLAGSTPPLGAAMDVFDPVLAYDSFVGQGGLTIEETVGRFGLVGGACNLSCQPHTQFDEAGINQPWNPAGGVVITDRTNFFVARITLSDDVMGHFRYAGFAGGQDPDEVIWFDAAIVNGMVAGAIFVPEPTTLILAGAVLGSLLTWRHANAR